MTTTLRMGMTAAALLALTAGDAAVMAGGQSPAGSTLTLALTGDSILTQRLSVFDEPPFQAVFEPIRKADAAFTNLETLFHDYEGPPAHESGGTWMRTEPPLLKELVWAGFDLVSRANNHAGDFGVTGQQVTSRHVREAGLVEAGVGNGLTEAREAKFLETPRGRIALVSAASTFTPHSAAGRTRGDMPARPGLSPLRFSTTYVVTPERLADLRRVAAEVAGRPPPEGQTLTFAGRQYEAGPKPLVRTEPNKEDLEEIARVVRSAKTLADLVIVSLHCHESGASRERPADFIATFARAMVDAGADVFVGHGPHVLRGIEVYKGKPIFYSLANFIFQNETLLRMPADSYDQYKLGPTAQTSDYLDARYDHDRRSFPADPEYWDSVVATTTWQQGRLVSMALHPITLGYKASRAARGRPMAASGADATRILDRLKALSTPMGTTIAVRDGVGVVEPAGETRQR